MTSETPESPAASGGATGTMEPVDMHLVDVEYLEFDPPGSPVSIHLNPVVAEGIANEVMEAMTSQFRRGAEVGGLLLGRIVSGPRPAVWIERYQRINCTRPEFILESNGIAALEATAAQVLAAGEFAVVGLYRSHTRPGFQLEQPDFELIRRYFCDTSDLILLIKPRSEQGMVGQFLAWDEGTGAHPAGGEFPFHGMKDEAEATRGTRTQEQIAEPPELPVSPRPELREHSRRLVPDFAPTPVEPSPSMFGLSGPAQSELPDELTVERGTREKLQKWLPLLAALLLVSGIVWFFVHPGKHQSSVPAAAQTTELARPLGLYVDPAGDTWRVSWNPNATALHNARTVRLFVHDKDGQGVDDAAADDQNRIDLSPQDLSSGSRQYRPMGNDVTFRLEVTDQAGRVSAESFRLVRAVNPPVPSTPLRPVSPPPNTGAARTVQPKAIYRAPAVVAAGVRARIKGTISIDVRVQIDARGRVISAAPVTKQHSGIDEYLAARAVQAARLWRFEPARDNGKAVAGTQILHFVFDK